MIEVIENGVSQNLDIDLSGIITNNNFTNRSGNITNIFTHQTKVQDKHKFQFIYQRNSQKEEYSLCSPTNCDESCKVIAIILESPHYEEYKYQDCLQNSFTIKSRTKHKKTKIQTINSLIPVEPANGSTGNLMKRWLTPILSNIGVSFGSYCVWVVNPVQWQTSLFMLHGESLGLKKYNNLRNDVWKKIWNISDIKTNFENRVNQLAPEYILNCCTKELQPLITYFLLSKWVGSNIEIYKSYHPSNWNKQERRVIKKIS